MATRKTQKKQASTAVRFGQKLVLNQWLLSLFETNSLATLAEHLKSPAHEGLDENNIHRFHHQLKCLGNRPTLPDDILLGYDQNIVKHTLAISHKRATPLKWKYFQYLCLLFTEIYLDRCFRDPARLLAALNRHLTQYNLDQTRKKDQLSPYQASDLTKIAFWNATGSGKTLLMHVNIRQYQHYLRLYSKDTDINHIILLTPNEGLSQQHLNEFSQSGIYAERFSKDARSLFSDQAVEIIEVTKLKEDMGQKTVAIDAFEGNNLVLVDEGHRGASSGRNGAWLDARDRLCENGFSFEYSATFGQAMQGKSGLEQRYAKNILFDYSYKYFYKDGFGKDYRILNLAEDPEGENRRLYFTACLLTFFQQQKLYQDNPNSFRPYLLEKPLWVFIGGSVHVKKPNQRKVSDVVDILLMLAEFVREKQRSVAILAKLLSGSTSLLNSSGKDIFSTTFSYLIDPENNPQNNPQNNPENNPKNNTGPEYTAALFDEILRTLFNANTQAKLRIEELKGADGELALQIGENDPFGLINIGKAAELRKACEQHQAFTVTEKQFSGSLFESINQSATINILIGSKKFTEGWNSWRVSTMGLMNVGRTEGSEIIQLFGRGVRLKGKNLSLKRSSELTEAVPPKHIQLLETLNIFGIRAAYMRQFKEYLEAEGLPDTDARLEIVRPVVKNLQGKNLTSLHLNAGKNFHRQGQKPTEEAPLETRLQRPVIVDWYPTIQAQQSQGLRRNEDTGHKQEGKLTEKHLAFMDINAIWFELQHFKGDRGWHNLNLPKESLEPLLLNQDWYTLYIPHSKLDFTSFECVRRWEEVAVALLKTYVISAVLETALL